MVFLTLLLKTTFKLGDWEFQICIPHCWIGIHKTIHLACKKFGADHLTQMNVETAIKMFIHCAPKNCHLFVFFREDWNFGIWSPEEMLHQEVVNLPTSPEIHYHTTLWNAQLVHWLFVTGILLRNFLFKQLRCELRISKSIDFYCFCNLFTPKLYRFPHKKWVALKRAGWCDVATWISREKNK